MVNRLVLAPSTKPLKGSSIANPLDRSTLKSSSRLPKIIPIIRGTMAATRDRIGISARPVVPNAIMVRNGPSFRDKIAIAPTSVLSPNSFARAV